MSVRYGLLGERLGHSFSREIHEKLGRYRYELIEVAPEKLDAFMRSRPFDGINVTIPYKQAVIPYLDDLSERARAIGAVNTIVNRDGKLYGDNTDFAGLEALIKRMGLDLRGRTVLICGTGGTSRTAAAVAEALRAGEIARLSRTARDGAVGYEEAYEKYAGAEILINTTPCGMFPDVDGASVDVGRFPGLRGVVDVIYNPLTTRLVREARAREIPAENGLYMLVAQAVEAAEVFLDEQFGAETVERIYREILFEKRNLVLIGMPGSGKSTIGKLLSARLGRELVDTDAEIVKRAGMAITEIFKTRGEAFFRDLESEVIRELSLTGGRIVATGGGAVLRSENVGALKMNGTIVFLDRPAEELIPTDDRPLSDDAEKMRALYAARYPIYTKAADLALPVRGTPEDTVKELLEMLK